MCAFVGVLIKYSSLHKPSTRVHSFLFGFFTPEDEPIVCPIMSLRNYHY